MTKQLKKKNKIYKNEEERVLIRKLEEEIFLMRK